MASNELFLICGFLPETMKPKMYTAVLREPVADGVFESYVHASDAAGLSAGCRRELSSINSSTPVLTVSSYMQVDNRTVQGPCSDEFMRAFLAASVENGFYRIHSNA